MNAKIHSLASLMGDYFGDNTRESSHPFVSRPLRESACGPSPIVPVARTSAWEIVASPNRFMRTFEFNDSIRLSAFVSEIMQYQEEIQHHGKLTIEHQKVTIEVYTHDINDITELDHEYVDMVDKISQDVMYYTGSDNNEEELDYGY